MKKEFIMRMNYETEKEYVSSCYSNVARMNFFEYLWYIEKLTFFRDTWSDLKEALRGFAMLLLMVFFTLICPIMILIRPIIAIHIAKKAVRKEQDYYKSKEANNAN